MNEDCFVVRKATNDDIPFIIRNVERLYTVRWPFVSARRSRHDIENWIIDLVRSVPGLGCVSILIHKDHPKAIIACACHTKDTIMVLFSRKELENLGYEEILRKKIGIMDFDERFKRLI